MAHSGTTAQDWVHVAIPQVRVSWLTLARLRALYSPCLCRCQRFGSQWHDCTRLGACCNNAGACKLAHTCTTARVVFPLLVQVPVIWLTVARLHKSGCICNTAGVCELAHTCTAARVVFPLLEQVPVICSQRHDCARLGACCNTAGACERLTLARLRVLCFPYLCRCP